MMYHTLSQLETGELFFILSFVMMSLPRHVKFWYFDTKSAKLKDCAAPLLGRSAILGEQRNNMFCDVSCGKGEMVDI